MGYRMLEDILPVAEIRLWAGEAMYTQSGGMAWMSDGFTSDFSVKGGLMKGLGRMFFGESLLMTTYMTSRPDSVIAFAFTVPRKILVVDTAKINLICQKGAFPCVQTTVRINTVLIKKFTAGLFDGEGSILQQIQGSGMVFLEVGGDVMERILIPGEVTKVDTGNVSVSEPSVSYEIETMKGVKNILFGDEGPFLTKPTGPGKIYM